jgi:hypothetical protein
MASMKAVKQAGILLSEAKKDAYAFASSKGLSATQQLLAKATISLTKRLSRIEAGVGPESFSAAQIRATLLQVDAVSRELGKGLLKATLSNAKSAATSATGDVAEYLGRLDSAYRGVGTQPLALREAAMLDRAVVNTESSILHRLTGNPASMYIADPAKASFASEGILARYGARVVSHFEETLQVGLLSRKPWNEVRADLIGQSPFLQGAPAYWAERIVRTETMAAYNKGSMLSMQEANSQLGDMVKILSATFDDRTGSDSIAVHGQIRRPDEPFAWWEGLYMHPPNRPNDREVVVPHRMVWPIPDFLSPRSDGEVIARWRKEKRKGSPPPRPLMSTVDRNQFG